MATYKSRFKGSQVDEAVTIANNNLNKGSADTPIFYDADGYGQAIEKDTIPTVSSTKPLTSGGAYTGLSEVVNKDDVQNTPFNGSFEIRGNVQVADGIASGFSGTTSYITFQAPTSVETLEIVVRAKFSQIPSSRADVLQTTINKGITLRSALGGSGRLIVYFSDSGVWTQAVDFGYNMVANTWVYLKITWDGSKYRTYYSLNGENWTLGNTITNGIRPTWGDGYMCLGGTGREETPFINGFIDLKNVYVKVNGSVFYTPYAQSSFVPSQNLAKQYIDSKVALKQPRLEEGYGISLDGDTINVNSDIIKKHDERVGLKVNHFEDYKLDNNVNVLNAMDDAKHSTFDLSKFSWPEDHKPKITNNGIASGFSSTEYLTTPQILISANTDVKIYTRMKTNFTSVAGQTTNNFVWAMGNYQNSPALLQQSSGFTLFLGSTENNNISKTLTVLDNTEYDFVAHFKKGAVSFYYKVASEQAYTLLGTGTLASGASFDSNIVLGYSSGASIMVLKGSLDLKRFNIIVNDVPVFSGNKTGVDTVKPKNYSVTSSEPTISEDGILSDCTDSKYIYFPANTFRPGSKPWKIKAKFRTGSTFDNAAIICMNFVGYANYGALIKINSNGTFNFQVYSDLNTNLLHGSGDYSNIALNTYYDLELEFTGSKYITRVNGEEGGSVDSTAIVYQGNTLENRIGARVGTSQPVIYGSIDLNGVQIYVDGDLIYQPCLKIPYTLTKEGKKIVDYHYRERVEDEYVQAEYTPYYTQQPLDQVYKVGSPTVNSDWVATDFSSSDYLTIPYTITKPNSMEWEVKFTTSNDVTSQQCIMNTSLRKMQIRVRNGKIELAVAPTIDSYHPSGNMIIMDASVNTTYHLKVGYDSNGFYAKDLINDTVIPLTTTDTMNSNETSFVIGNFSVTHANVFKGFIDLKYLSIVVDGEEVFNGNKTGIDTLNSTNFMAYTSDEGSPFEDPGLPFNSGTLTITSDGIASGFSSGNYLTTTFPGNVTSYEVDFKFKTSSVSGENIMLGNMIFGAERAYYVPQIRRVDKVIKFYGPKNTTIQSGNIISANTWYWIKAK